MGKTKTPFFSLGARGTIGDSLTAQKRGRQTLIRQKPIPAYRKTLPQQYQRWLYEDYAYLWRQQDEATRKLYTAAGVRFHLTGFQYWMKYHLKNLPDIYCWLRLEQNISSPTADSSPFQNHATFLGASPHVGLIDNALSFDGLNDSLLCPCEGLPAMNEGTFLLNMKPLSGQPLFRYYFNWDRSSPNQLRMINRLATGNKPRFCFSNGLVQDIAPINIDQWYQFGFRWHSDATWYWIQDGVATLGGGVVTLPFHPAHALSLASLFVGTTYYDWTNVAFDNILIFNRPLDDTEIARWNERRYPA